VRDAVIVGHSMGGMALMKFCADARDVMAEVDVRGVVFLSTAAFDVPSGPGGALIASARRWVLHREGITRRFGDVPPGDLGWAAVRYTFGLRPPADGIALVRRLTEDMEPSAVARSFTGFVDHDERASLPTLPVPALVIVGSHDRLTPPSKARAIASLIPADRVELVEIEGPGHLIMLEQPYRFEDLVRKFVARVGPR
jgi:pimeloyl-ACP methyl ester carboxylesterase